MEGEAKRLTGQCSPVWILTPRCSEARCRNATLPLDLLKPNGKFIRTMAFDIYKYNAN